MTQNKWGSKLERGFELSVIGIVLFIGIVSIFYSYIDSAFNVNVNVYLLTAAAGAATALIVYLIKVFDKG